MLFFKIARKQCIFYLLLLICIVLPTSSFCNESNISERPALRIVHNLNNPPFKFVDSNGDASGLLIDLWRLWADKSGREVEFVAAPWDKTLEMVRDGEADIHAGLFYSLNRDEYLDFSTPLFNLEYYLFVHDSIQNVNTLKDLYGFRIGVPKGYSKTFLEEKLPGIALSVYDDFPTLYEAARCDEVRIFISPQFNYADFLQKHLQEEYHQHRFSPSFSVYNRNYLGAIREGRQQLLSEINEGLAKITPEEQAAVEYKWLNPGVKPMESNVLRISMSANYHPLTFLDADGKASGFLVDLWRLWSQKTGRKIIFLSSTWQNSVEAVFSNKADIHSGLMKNTARSEWMQFSEPVYGLSSRFYFPADKRAVQTLSDISSQRVGIIKGTWQLNYLQKNLSGSQIITFDNSATMVNALREGKIELIFDEDLTIDKILERQRLRGLIYNSSKPISIEPIFAGILSENNDLMAEINKGFNKITQSELLELERRWIKDSSHRFYHISEQNILLRLHDSEKIWLKDHQQVKVGGSADWTPIGFVDQDDQPQGITTDYLKLIGKRLNIDFQINTKLSWSENINQARNRKIDIMANIVKTEERSQFLRFSIPYFNCPYAIVTRRMNDQLISGIRGLHKKTVAVERDYYLHSQLSKDHPEIRLFVVDSTLEALEAVSNEKADAYIGNSAVISWLIEHKQLQNLKTVGNTGYAPTLLRFGVRKDWPELVSILNKALGTITQEEHKAIRKKWFDIEKVNAKEHFNHISITPTEQVWLDSLAPVRLGVDSNWAPLEYLDNNRQYSGISSDFISRFTQQLGITIAPVDKMTWPEALNRIGIQDLDIIPMISPTAERGEYLNFTKPFIDFPRAIFTRHDSNLITGLEDLAGKRLAVEKDNDIFNHLKRDYPNLNVIGVPTTLDALEAVSYGRVDAFVGNLLTGSYLIDHEGLANIKIAAPAPYRSSFSIGVRKDWPEMIPLLNKAIDSLTEADKTNIRQNWLSVRYDKKIDYSVIWQILTVSTIIILLVLWRNRELNRRKKQLEASEKQFKLLINAMPIAIVVVDRNGTIIFDNPQAGREMGDNKSIVGRTSREFYVNASDQRHVFTTLAKKGAVVGRQVQYHVDSGRIIDCILSVIPIRFDGEDVLLGVSINVTERVKMQEALEKAMTKAEESDQLKSAFLASMSHELRTPLNSIIGFTGIILQGLAGPLNTEQNKQLTMVQTSSKHLLALINDVLDISKIEAGELDITSKEFEMRAAIEKVVQTVTPLAVKQGLELRVDISPDVGMIYSDQRRVEQVLFNLLGNGVKFTDTGVVSVSCRIEKSMLVTNVKDTGSGIKADDMDKLFQTFIQIDTGLDRTHEGTGLGLSISKKLVDKLGGDMQVSSEWGVGSTFTFRLPYDSGIL